MENADPKKRGDYLAQLALDRMRRAADRGTGCHLTAEMIQSLALTVVGQIWEQPNPVVDVDE